MEKIVSYIFGNASIIIILLPEILIMTEIFIFHKTNYILHAFVKRGITYYLHVWHIILIYGLAELCYREHKPIYFIMLMYSILWSVKDIEFRKVKIQKKILCFVMLPGILISSIVSFFILHKEQNDILILIVSAVSLFMGKEFINFCKTMFYKLYPNKIKFNITNTIGKIKYEERENLRKSIEGMKATLSLIFIFIIIGMFNWYYKSKHEYSLGFCPFNQGDNIYISKLFENMNNNRSEEILIVAAGALIFIVSLYKICNKAEKKLREKNSENITRKLRRQKYNLKAKRNGKF